MGNQRYLFRTKKEANDLAAQMRKFGAKKPKVCSETIEITVYWIAVSENDARILEEKGFDIQQGWDVPAA